MKHIVSVEGNFVLVNVMANQSKGGQLGIRACLLHGLRTIRKYSRKGISLSTLVWHALALVGKNTGIGKVVKDTGQSLHSSIKIGGPLYSKGTTILASFAKFVASIWRQTISSFGQSVKVNGI